MLYSIKKLFIRFISKRHSFRLSILALFLSLFAVAFVCVMTFTYSKNYTSILTFSRTVANETIATIRAKFETMTISAEQIIRTSAGFFPNIGTLDASNPILDSYLLNMLKNDEHFSSIYIGLPNGDFVGAISPRLSAFRYFAKEPTKKIPDEIQFILYSTDRTTSPSKGNFHYLNKDFTQIEFETVSPASYNATERPWYIGAEQKKSLFWTGFYSFLPYKKIGTSIGCPIIINGQLVAVVGADLSLALLSDFLSVQKISKSGRAFILDQDGQIIVPETLPSSSPISFNLVEIAYKQFLKHPETTDFIFTHEGKKYLSFFTKFPGILGTNGMITVVAPLEDFLGSVIETQNQILLFILAIVVISTFVVIHFSKRIASPIVTLAQEINKIREFNLSSKIRVDSNIKEIFLLDNAIASMRHVIESFSKYVPKEIVKKLLGMNKEISFGGEKKEITIFFSDISSFTSIAESQPIDTLFPLLTEYFDAMSKIIVSLQGTIDKFIGDGIMAFWGAPVDIQDHVKKACDAALICHAMLESFNAKRRKEGKPEFPTRFGIHSGMVIVGNIGTEDRLNYTIIGDAVNTTARLQEVDKVYHTSIIISEEVYLKLGKEYIARPLDIVLVKGKLKKLKIYELIGKLDSREDIRPSNELIDLCNRFTQAFESMQEKRLEEARVLFSSIAASHPNDFPTQIYLKRISETLSN